MGAVTGDETDVDGFVFSFERTPLYESWFQTYTRQDQGEEILYYPEPKSFQLPYEMPAGTWYPRKPKEAAAEGDRDKPSSKKTSARGSAQPSGTATPMTETRSSRTW